MSPDRKRSTTFGILLALLPVATLCALAIGSVSLPPLGVARSLLDACGLHVLSVAPLRETGETILWTIRLPRVLLAGFVGGGLAVVGAVLQSVFRNPIADSGLLGVGAGAALGAVLAVRLGLSSILFLALPGAAFMGALGAIAAVYGLAHLARRSGLEGLLLTGIAVSAVASAATSTLLVTTDEYRIKTILFWLAGGLDGRSWPHLQLTATIVLPASGALLLLSRPLDVLGLGDEEAASLGLPVRSARLVVLGLAALLTGAVTAMAGAVPFVGLISPHALRPLVGPMSRHLLPAAFLGGALLVILADLVARSVNAGFDLPLGSLTALVGAPYFLIALRGVEDSP